MLVIGYIPVISEGKTIYPEQLARPLCFCISADDRVAVMDYRGILVLDRQGNEKFYPNEQWEYDCTADDFELKYVAPIYTSVLLIGESGIALSNWDQLVIKSKSREGTIQIDFNHNDSRGTWINRLCKTPEGDIAVIDSYGRVRIYKPTGEMVDKWRVNLRKLNFFPAFSFAVLPEKRVAVVFESKQDFLLYDRYSSNANQEPRAKWIKWRSNTGFAQIFYSQSRKEIMLFDRHRQVICCGDSCGKHLYDLQIDHVDYVDHVDHLDYVDYAKHPHNLVQQVFITENRIALLKKSRLKIATIF